MALVSFRPHLPRSAGGSRNDQRLLMYRFSKNRSKSCGATSRRGQKDLRSIHVYELLRESRGRSRDKSIASLTRDPKIRRANFKDSVMVMTHSNGTNGPENARKGTKVIVDLTQKEVDKLRKMTSKTRSENISFARLDMKTIHNMGWVSGAKDEQQSTNIAEAEDFYKMTKVEFRRLQEQVRDVSMNLKNKFRTSAYQPNSQETHIGQKLYQRPNENNPNQVYRSQLAASLRAFQQKQWPPLSHAELENNYMRCKPVQPAYERPSTSCSVRAGSPTRLQRPKSVPASSLRPKSGHLRRSDTPKDVRPGKFDTLSPTVISEFMRQSEANSPPADLKSPLIEELVAETKQLVDNDDTSTTSGIDSGASDNESPSSDEDSDYEPDIDESITIPQLNLRPEKLDSLYIPEPKRGWRQYDFDMTNIDLPPYEFANPFPDYMEDLDLRQMAKLKWNWRNHVKVKTVREPDLEGMLDRLVEFERLQSDTIEWENKRAAQIKKQLPKRNNSAKSFIMKDKRCDPNCLQNTCFGDCPEKLVQSNSCENCRQGYCTGNCKETKYEQRMRQPRSEDERPITPKTPFPRACTSCQKRHNAKFINANNLILGAQRFGNSTYTRGQGSSKVKDVRPKTPSTLSKDVLREFEKLNIDTTQPSRPSTAVSMASRPRSRNGMFPGKSFSSQRKNSLTEIDKIGIPKKQKRSKSTTKMKRPKTAG